MGAIKKHKPICLSVLFTVLISALIFTPNADNISEDPEFEETDLFPCLATLIPQEAATIATAVDILYVPRESPPVPQVSRVLLGLIIFLIFFLIFL